MASLLESKTLVVITGANTGLGFETAKALYARPDPYHIVIGCRGDISRATDAVSKLEQLSPDSPSTAEPLAIDITSDDSIAAAFTHLKERFGYIDVLVNNAGADLDQAVESGQLSAREGWNQTYDVNVTGTHLFTAALAPLLLAPAPARQRQRQRQRQRRLVFVTSGLASVAEHAAGTSPRHALAPGAGAWPKPATNWLPYRVSKTALNMVAVEWGRLLRNDAVAVFALSPGFLDTGLGDDRASGRPRPKRPMGALNPAVGAAFCADVVEGKRDAQAWPVVALRRDAVQPW